MTVMDFGFDAGGDIAPSIEIRSSQRGYVLRPARGSQGLRNLAWSLMRMIPLSNHLQSAYEVEVNTANRAIIFYGRAFGGAPIKRLTMRFEEIVDVDIEKNSFLDDLRASFSAWDYGRIYVTRRGKRPVRLLGGDIADLEPLVERLRAQAGIV